MPSQYSAAATLYRHMCLRLEHTRMVSGLGMSAEHCSSCFRGTRSCGALPPLLPLQIFRSAQSAFSYCDVSIASAAAGSLSPASLHHRCCPCRFSEVPSQHSAAVTLYSQMSWLAEHTRVVLGPGMSAALFTSCFRVISLVIFHHHCCLCRPRQAILIIRQHVKDCRSTAEVSEVG